MDACECGDELPFSLKCGEFVDKMCTCLILRKDSVARINGVAVQ